MALLDRHAPVVAWGALTLAPMLACSFLPWARWIDGGVGPGDRAVVHRVDLWQLWSNDLDASAVGLARYRWIVNLVVATVVLAAIAALRRSTGFAVLAAVTAAATAVVGYYVTNGLEHPVFPDDGSPTLQYGYGALIGLRLSTWCAVTVTLSLTVMAGYLSSRRVDRAPA